MAAGSKVTFELTYEELLKRHKGKYEMFLKVQPKQLVKHFEVIDPPAASRRPRGAARAGQSPDLSWVSGGAEQTEGAGGAGPPGWWKTRSW